SSFVDAHHQRNAARAARTLHVEHCAEPTAWSEDWIALYAQLVQRHRITGIPAFPPAALGAQLAVPGMVLLRAAAEGETVGITLWYVAQNVAYYHLGAYSARGYDLGASFALFWFAIEHFTSRVRWLALGAGAGAYADGQDGLTRFKRGWATGT